MHDGPGATPPRSPFETCSTQDAIDLIAGYPLAWVAPRAGDAPPGLLPLLAERGADGAIVSLFGHMARRNPLVRAFEADGRATILFTGPQAYLPTTLVSDRAWAPTWVYAQLSITADVALLPDETERAIAALTERMEGAAGSGWRPEMVGPRYAGMVGAIIAFRATVTAIAGRFKLGQDETDERLREIVAGLPDGDLRRWIARFNPGR